jgi:hypothetical protein
VEKVIIGSSIISISVIGSAILIANSTMANEYYSTGLPDSFCLISAIEKSSFSVLLLILIMTTIIGFAFSIWGLVEKHDENYKKKILVGGSMIFAGAISALILFTASIKAGTGLLQNHRINHPYLMYLLLRFWHIHRHQLQIPLIICAAIAIIGLGLCSKGFLEKSKYKIVA